MTNKRLDEKHAKILRQLVQTGENIYCMECRAKCPMFANLFNNTFLCTRCSGLVREFSHRVKSISASTFTPEEIKALQEGGNEMCRRIWLANYRTTDYQQPTESDGPTALKDWIRVKYVQKKWYNPSVAAAVTTAPTPAAEHSLQFDGFPSVNNNHQFILPPAAVGPSSRAPRKSSGNRGSANNLLDIGGAPEQPPTLPGRRQSLPRQQGNTAVASNSNSNNNFDLFSSDNNWQSSSITKVASLPQAAAIEPTKAKFGSQTIAAAPPPPAGNKYDNLRDLFSEDSPSGSSVFTATAVQPTSSVFGQNSTGGVVFPPTMSAGIQQQTNVAQWPQQPQQMTANNFAYIQTPQPFTHQSPQFSNSFPQGPPSQYNQPQSQQLFTGSNHFFPQQNSPAAHQFMQQQMSQQYYNGQSQLQQQQQPSPMYNVTTTAAPQMSDQSATNPFLNASAYQSMAGSNAVSAVVANPFVISGNVNSAAAQNPFAVSQSTIPRKSTDNPFAAGPSHLAFPTDSNNTTANVTTTNPFLMSSTQPQFGWQ